MPTFLKYLAAPLLFFSIDLIAAEPQHLALQRLEFDAGPEQTVPLSAIVADGHLILATYGNLQFRAFELPLTSESFTGVRQGRGPGETFELDHKSLTSTGDGFWFADGLGIRSGSIKNKKILITGPNTKFSAPMNKNGMVKVKNGYVDMNTGNDGHEYILYNDKFSSRELVGSYPKWDRMGLMLPVFSYVKFMASRPDGSRFVSAYVRYAKVRIYDERVRKIKEIDLSFGRKSTGPDDRYYVCKPCVNDHLIYLLSHKGEKDAKTAELQVLDWAGKVLARYAIDVGVDFFTVDFATGTVYLFAHEEPDAVYFCDIQLES